MEGGLQRYDLLFHVADDPHILVPVHGCGSRAGLLLSECLAFLSEVDQFRSIALVLLFEQSDLLSQPVDAVLPCADLLSHISVPFHGLCQLVHDLLECFLAVILVRVYNVQQFLVNLPEIGFD